MTLQENNTVDMMTALDRFIGTVEDIIITDEFQCLITTFMDKYHPHFDYDDENKLCYTEIFEEYRRLVESYLTQEIEKATSTLPDDHYHHQHLEALIARIPLNSTLPTLQDQGEVIELILSLTDFLVFKELMLDHKTAKSGQYDHFDLLQVISIDIDRNN